MPVQTLMSIAQTIPVLEKLDASDGWTLATIVFIQVMNLWVGDELFHLIIGLACGGLVCLTGLRLLIKAYGEWQDVRMKKIKADQAEHQAES